MITLAVSLFSFSLLLFIAVAFLVKIEERRGSRLCAVVVRKWLDERLQAGLSRIDTVWKHFTQYVLRLGWYYGIHSLLRTLLRVLVSAYTYVEVMFERNRLRTKELRQERRRALAQSHFDKIAHHKAATALSPEAEAALKHDKLEYDH